MDDQDTMDFGYDHDDGYSDSQRMDETDCAQDYDRFEEEQVFQDHEGDYDEPTGDQPCDDFVCGPF